MTFMDRLKNVFKEEAPAAPAPTAPTDALRDFERLLERYRAAREHVLNSRVHDTPPGTHESRQAEAEAALRALVAAPGSPVTAAALDAKLRDVDYGWHVGDLANAKVNVRALDASTPERASRLEGHVEAERQAHGRLQEFCLATGRDLEGALRDVEMAIYAMVAK